jgi:ABC-type branched-subunit amino acid transport system substrate-binding protein
VNDQLDPAVALSAARQLVTHDDVFAIVPDISPVNPVRYLASHHVPYVGYGIDSTYCSSRATTSLWGYSFVGCQVPANPTRIGDTLRQVYDYGRSKTGTAHPTLALFSDDNQSGTSAVRFSTVSAKGAGFRVIYNRAPLPTAAADYTPYVVQLMSSDHGNPPQVIACLGTEQCIPMYAALRNAGYHGIYVTPGFGAVAALNASMQGSLTTGQYNSNPNPGLTMMEKSLDAVAPGTQPAGFSNVPAYFSASMFAAAVHQVQSKKVPDTPENVQTVLSGMHWGIPGLVGPIEYPQSTAAGTPYCSELILHSGGGNRVVQPYDCSYRQFVVTPAAERSG